MVRPYDTEQRHAAGVLGVLPLKWSTNRDMMIPFFEDTRMAGKREKPEHIVLKLRQVEVLQWFAGRRAAPSAHLDDTAHMPCRRAGRYSLRRKGKL